MCVCVCARARMRVLCVYVYVCRWEGTQGIREAQCKQKIGTLIVGVLHPGNIRIGTDLQNWALIAILYIALPHGNGNQDAGAMTQYPTQSHYPDTELTSPCSTLVIPRIKLHSDKHQLCMSLI